MPLRLTAVASATDAAFQKKIYVSGMNKLIISNEEMKDVMKVVKYLEESSLLTKDVSETIKNEANNQKSGLASMLLGTLAASVIGNVLIVKAEIPGQGITRAVKGAIRAGEETTRVGLDF